MCVTFTSINSNVIKRVSVCHSPLHTVPRTQKRTYGFRDVQEDTVFTRSYNFSKVSNGVFEL